MIWICLCFADSPQYLVHHGLGCAYFDFLWLFFYLLDNKITQHCVRYGHIVNTLYADFILIWAQYDLA